MRFVCSSSRVVIAALAVGIMAIAAQPVMADVENLTIISPNNLAPFEGSAPTCVAVEFAWSDSYFPQPFPETFEGFQATISIGLLDGPPDEPISNPISQEIFFYDKDDLPALGAYSEIEEICIAAGTLPDCYALAVEVQEQHSNGLCCGQIATEPAVVCIEDSMTGGPTGVPVDIKPSSCPNPINLGKGGVIPVAIAGTEDLDVLDIDPESVCLMGVGPIRWNYEDVATPYFPNVDDPDCMDCTEKGGDGILDLTLKFDAQELVEAIRWCYGDELVDRDCLILFLDGELRDGTPIAGEDVVRIQGGGPGNKFDKDKADKGKPDKDKSGKGKSGKGKSGKGKPKKGK